MKGCLLKLYVLSFCLIQISITAPAQDFLFIYIQTENQTPFYIKMNHQSISSTSSGYIIIPRLTAGAYKIEIGFPQSEQQRFNVIINLSETDAGYIIKTDIDHTWYMAELLTKKVVRTERYFSDVNQWEIKKSKDEFARVLSEVVNDSTIIMTKIKKKIVETYIEAPENKSTDTVTVLKREQDNTAAFKTVKLLPETQCKNIATNTVFLKLFKQVQGQKKDTDKRALATKALARNCFNTRQIKELGLLFITEAERYRFYVSAFRHVSDRENFATLQEQLTNDYYINRFKAMLHH
jgi:hypothetical protein